MKIDANLMPVNCECVYDKPGTGAPCFCGNEPGVAKMPDLHDCEWRRLSRQTKKRAQRE